MQSEWGNQGGAWARATQSQYYQSPLGSPGARTAPASPCFLTALSTCHIPIPHLPIPAWLSLPTSQLLPSSPPLFTPAPHLLHPSPPSLPSQAFMSSSFADGQMTPPPQRRSTGGECRIHFFITGRLFLERMIHRPHNGGRGYPHAGGEGVGAESQQAWPGTAPRPKDTHTRQANSQGRLCPLLLQNPSVPRVRAGPEAGEAWRGRAPGRLCYQGVSLRKGCRTPAQPHPLRHLQCPGTTPGVGKGVTPAAGGS